MSVIYTIGYSAFEFDKFIEVLKHYGIRCVVDVRSVPFSRRYPCYNQNVLKNSLKAENIDYRDYSDEFGARQTDKAYFSNEGYLDFKKYTKSNKFNKGYEQICKEAKNGYIFVLMCAEADPIDCHRNIMLAREFFKRGFEVRNIMKNGRIESQQEIENRLLDRYFCGRNQISLFEDMNDKNYLVDCAYMLRNKEIGYKL